MARRSELFPLIATPVLNLTMSHIGDGEDMTPTNRL